MSEGPLNELAARIHEWARGKGDWDENPPPDRKLMLAVSELVEAHEEYRKGHPLDQMRTEWIYESGRDQPWPRPHTIETGLDGRHYLVDEVAGHRRWTAMTDKIWLELGYRPKPEGVPVELADAIVRILDMCAAWGIDIDEVVAHKMAYNERRPYKHGKALS